MCTQPGTKLDAWLREGGTVVASGDRAARAIQAEFHRRRQAEGLSVWPVPNVVSWDTFLRRIWEERNVEGELLLNPAQERALWSQIIQSDEQHLPTALPQSARRLASMAMEAHELLCSHAPELLRESERKGWDHDAGAFSGWLADFDKRCGEDKLISASRIALKLISALRRDSSARPALRIAGFDRLLPVQKELFDAWGSWKQIHAEQGPAQIHFHSASEMQTEFEACAIWCHRELAADRDKRLLVITQDLTQSRGEIERAFLRFSPAGTAPLFEFSLGIPLSQTPLVRSALLLLHWLSDDVSENQLDWLFASGHTGTPEESAALQSCMRALRRRDLQRPRWALKGFLSACRGHLDLSQRWERRMIAAHDSLKKSNHPQNSIDWSDKIPRVLGTTGWPGTESESSVDFQILRRWQQALDTAGSLGFDGRRISWSDFLSELEHIASDTLFAPQSVDAHIQIAGPAESAGLTADAIWFLGADEDSWPAVASMHPFLPPSVQRRAQMPHASHLHDWQFSSAITDRLLASAPEVHFSFARQKGDVEARPSRLILQLAGALQLLPADMIPTRHQQSVTIPFPDATSVPFEGEHLRGGAGTLSSQSQCPFKAFAGTRLSARDWDPAEAGLSAKQRGQILHAVLRSIWSGPPDGLNNHSELRARVDLSGFVRNRVQAVLQAEVPQALREMMPRQYLELEETRLVRLITEWLNFESHRIEFSVEATELKRTVTIARLSMNLRLDRVDRLRDGSQLVIDYKTGSVDPKSWDLPRPEDVQLPLYKLFGLDPLQPPLFDSYGGPASGGVVFAKVRAGETCLVGRVADARATINANLNGNSALVRRRLTGAEESAWRKKIEELADDFIHGRAEVDPRDYPKTCERCGLQSVCRIQEPENRARFEKNTEARDAAEE
jgi:probable DNA repair protein